MEDFNFIAEITKLKGDVKELQDRLIDRTATLLKREAKYLRQIHKLHEIIEHLNNDIDVLLKEKNKEIS